MTTGGPSKADEELAASISRVLGEAKTPRQIERWRQEGAIEPPIRKGRGQGLGTVAFYPPEATEKATVLARALKERGSLAEAALISFLRGANLKEVPLKRFYRKVFTDIRSFLGATPESDPWEVADRMSHRFTRRASTVPTAKVWRDRLKARGKPDQLGPMLQDLLRFAVGGAENEETLSKEVLEAVIDDAAEEITEPQRQEFDDLIQLINIPALERVMEQSDLATLRQARDQVGILMGLFPGGRDAIPSNIEFAMAVIAVPAVIVAGGFFGTAFARGLASLMEEGVRQE
jgi:hypothetical protein